MISNNNRAITLRLKSNVSLGLLLPHPQKNTLHCDDKFSLASRSDLPVAHARI